MDAFPFIFAGTTAGALGYSIYSAYQSFKGVRNVSVSGNADHSNYKETASYSKGSIKMTNVLSVFPDGTIRTRDGGYIKGYKFRASESFYASDDAVRRLYDSFAMLLTSEIPKDSVIQIRFDNQIDNGNMLNEQVLEMQSSFDECDPVAQLLKQEELAYYFELAANGNFRTGNFTAWVYIPSARKGTVKNGFDGIWESLAKGNLKGAKNSLFSNEKAVICRLVEDEEKCFEKAARHFRAFEQSFPLPTKAFTFDETCVHLRLSHNPNALSIPTPPKQLDTDWQSYLSRTKINHNKKDWFLWHGNTPVTVITMFEPPESNAENPTCYPGLMKFITTNPTLRARCTVISEYITFDKDESVKKLKDEIKRMKEANTRPEGFEIKDEKVLRIYNEKIKMLKELTSRSKALTNMRFHIVVRGDEVKYKEDRKAALKSLEDQAQDIIKLINQNMQGAQADLEDAVALRSIYEKTLLGELCPKLRQREIKEQALSLACFIPAEKDWNGITNNPHNFFVNTSGELVGVNLLRNQHTQAPLTIILGVPGSGKTVTAAVIICGVLASVPRARVIACDYGGSLAPLVNLFEGRYFRFSEKDRRTINVWDYNGLENAEAPTDEQIELVVKDTMILLGADERTETGMDFISVLQKCVVQVYKDEIPRNAPGRRHEPRLSHLIRKLRSFPFESPDETKIAQRMASRLEKFEGNPWVDAETDESYRQQSRFDVFELSSLDKLPDSLRSCLAFRIGARVGTGSSDIDGINLPELQVFDEAHEFAHNEYLKYVLIAAEKTTRHGRKKNKIPLIITHTLDDIKDYPGLTSNIGNIFVGKQDDITSLKNLKKWNSPVEQTIYNIDNAKGVAHQFVYATGQGEKQKFTTIQVYLSSMSLWTFTTDPPEDEARKVMANALPHWSWAQIIVALARKYERGLSAIGKTKIDDEWLQEIVNQEQQFNPQYKQYVKNMQKMKQNLFELPEEIDFEEFADEAIDVISENIDKIKRDNFADIGVSPELEQLGFDVQGAFKVVEIQGEKL